MLESDVALFIKTVLVIVGALLPIVNPVGGAPFFLALTEGADRPTRHALSATVAMNSFLLLAGSLVLGHFVLRLFGLSIPVVQFAGGLVLCLLGARMLSDDDSAQPQAKDGNDAVAFGRAFYPLTLPLTVDPGTISVAITIGANHPRHMGSTLVVSAAATAALAIIAASVWFCYHYAERVSNWLGKSRVMVMLRLSAFVMLCIGVNISWNGVKGLLEEVTIKTAPAVQRDRAATERTVQSSDSATTQLRLREQAGEQIDIVISAMELRNPTLIGPFYSSLSGCASKSTHFACARPATRSRGIS